ncbi:MFS transporter [Microcella sp.]|uniref:MFS transporter n=1 Tax=Microcella sp. TaxID=1913979 RepID=UPI00391A4A6D
MSVMSARRVRGTFYVLTFGNTIAASFIWGINTLFLLDAGLSNLEAFAANAFFTLGMVVFEIPTGVVADTWGRRASYLLGTLTLAATTALYWLMWLWQSPFWAWALVSVLLGLGFTFFTGAVDAWLVDALHATGYQGSLEAVFGRAQVVSGVSMLSGSVLGGLIAQLTNLGVPFLVRVGVLLVMVVVAGLLMRDLGFTPTRGAGPVTAVRTVMRASIDHGFRRPAIRWVMIATPFTAGVGIYAFYALQPYLLEVAGDSTAYALAGLAAAIFAGSSIVGGALAPVVRRAVRRRTTVLIGSVAVSSAVLMAFVVVDQLWLAIALLAAWGLTTSVAQPAQRSYLNDMIPSAQRATVLSFHSLLGSAGGIGTQPALGRTADLNGYGFSLLVGGVISACAVPFLALSRAQRDPADEATTLVVNP